MSWILAPEPPMGGSHPGTTYTRFLILIAFILVSVPRSCSVPRSFRSVLVFRSAPLGCGYPVVFVKPRREEGFSIYAPVSSCLCFLPFPPHATTCTIGTPVPRIKVLVFNPSIYRSCTSLLRHSPHRRGLVRGLLPQVPWTCPSHLCHGS